MNSNNHQTSSADDETAGGVSDRPEPDAEESDRISTDELFALLSNGRRRRALRILSENDGALKLRELATTIAAEENGLDPVEVDYTQRKRLYTSLYQSHLPRMERNGVVTHDRNSGLVTLASEADRFDAYLEVVGEDEFTWSEFYAGLAGLFAVVTLAYATETPPLVTVGPTALMATLTLVLLVSALAHVRYTRRRRV